MVYLYYASAIVRLSSIPLKGTRLIGDMDWSLLINDTCLRTTEPNYSIKHIFVIIRYLPQQGNETQRYSYAKLDLSKENELPC